MIHPEKAHGPGHQINSEKSSTKFGHKIEEPIKHELYDILEIHNLGGMKSYLESPNIWEDQNLIFLVLFKNIINNRVNGWTFKFFIKGRKGGIIKSLVTDLTNHLISCFRIPKTVTKKLTRAVAQFGGI